MKIINYLFFLTFIFLNSAHSKAKPNDLYIPSLKMRIQAEPGSASPLEAVTEACEKKKSDSSCYVLYNYYKDNNKLTEARKFQIKSCDLKHVQACLELGSDYFFREKNMALAQKAFEYPCEKGDSGGCNNLAAVYEEKKDISNAIKFYTKSCNLGLDRACLGEAYLKMESGDCKGAIKIFKPLCSKGDKESCQRVSECTAK